MRLTSTLSRIGRGALRFGVCAAVFAKLLVPVGYMPGPLSAGLPLQLCDAGFSVVVPHEHAGHAGHGGGHAHHDKASELQWKHCPSGALAAAGAIPVEYRLDLEPVASERFALSDATGVTRTPFIAFRSRAPPLDSALV